MAAVESQEKPSTYLDDPLVASDALAPQGQPCRNCGCPVEPADRFCPACGTPHATAAGPSPDSTSSPQKHFRCSNCGSEMSADPDQRSYVCPFCDSTYVVEFSPEDTDRQRPEFVIGFAVTREQAQKQFRQWIRNNSWFRPGDLATQAVADKQQGVYLPFWSFSMLAKSSWSASIGEYWYRTETYTTRDSKGRVVTRTRQVRETEWWPLSGRHHHYYSGFLISGSHGLPQQEAQRIMPFNLPALRRYEPYYLAGWLCEEYSVQREDALQVSLAEFSRREQQSIAAFLPGDTHRSLQVDTQFGRINSDLCLLPVYVLSYRYQNRLYRYLVNGQTGKADGDKPWSWGRIGGAIAGLVVLVLVAVLLVLLLNR
jgi:hypothetical protein